MPSGIVCRDPFISSRVGRIFRFYTAGAFDTAGRKPETKKGSNHVQITLNGEPFDIEQPLSVVALLERLELDARRVAVEHNLTIVKRHRFPEVMVTDGDQVEIVNFVGGG
jgi:sulfur carrier protein